MRLLFALIATFFVTTASANPPLEAYGELPEIRLFDFSPDGDRFAFVLRKEGRELMVVFEIGANGPQSIGMVDLTDTKVRGIDFITKNHVVITASQSTKRFGGYEDSQSSSFNIATGEVTVLASKERTFRFFPSTAGGNLTPTDDPDVVLFTVRIGEKGDYPDSVLVRSDLTKARASIEVKGGPYTIDWLITKQGVAIAREDFNDRGNTYAIMTHRKGRWETVYEESGVQRPPMNLVGYTPDESALIVCRDDIDKAFQTCHTLSFDGVLSEPLYGTDSREPGGFYADSWGKMFGIVYAGFKPTFNFFDADLTALMNNLAAAYPDDSVWLSDWTDDFSKLVISISGGKTAPAYFLFDRATNNLSKLTAKYLRIGDADIMPVKLFDYKARDGLSIPSMLTHPRGTKAGDKLPLIVLPHGGPEAYDSLGFDYWAQYFANRGYIVLQPNFRGSEGFGSKHRRAGYGEWGGKMQDDIEDGTKYLINSGWADPDRICIMGASYGGYAALAGGAFTPDLYKCVVAVAPVSDMQDLVSEEKFLSGRYSATLDYLRDLLGDMIDNTDKLKSVSPTNYASAFKAPVLLMHGTDDTVVPYSHSTKMQSALQAAGKDVTFVKLSGEDHWMSTSETRLQGLREIDAFIQKHIGPAN